MAHAAMAWDPTLVEGAASRIREQGEDGVAAILASGAAAAAQLAALDDPLLAARAADVLDVADRIARILAGLPTDEVTLTGAGDRRRRGPVAVDDRDAAARAHPGDPARGRLADRPCRDPRPGVRDPGGRRGARHALATLAAAGPDAEVVLDGATGEVVVAPDPETGAEFDARAARHARVRAADASEASLPAVTTRRRRGHAAREHRHAGGGRAGPRAGGPRRRAVPDGVPVPRTVHAADRGRAGRRVPRGGRGVRGRPGHDPAARHRRRQADPVPADAGRGEPVPRRPRAAAGPRPPGAVRHPAAGVLPGGRRGAGEGDGADGRGRRGRDAAARPRGAGARRSWRRRASRSGPWTSA